MDYNPPITITAPIARLCVEVGTLVGSLEAQVPPRDLKLVDALHTEQLASLAAAEGMAPGEARDVERALREAFPRFSAYDPTSLSDLMRLNALIANAMGSWDIWRTGDVELPESLGITPAPPERVLDLLERLLDWYAGTDLHPLVASSIFRIEYLYIQPFACACNYTGRLWHHLMLVTWSPVLRWTVLEEAIRERREDLRAAIRESRTRINDAPYVTFMLESIVEALRRLESRLEGVSAPAGKAQRLLAYFFEHPEATIARAADALDMAPRTCARYVAALQSEGKLERVGSRRTGSWRVL